MFRIVMKKIVKIKKQLIKIKKSTKDNYLVMDKSLTKVMKIILENDFLLINPLISRLNEI